jgi:hypothetical protein
MTVWDAPNQQVVREDQSAPWDEGTGGVVVEAAEEEAAAEEAGEPTLDEMTKAELIEYAQSRGISPANNDMTKQELRDSIAAAEG